MTADNTIMEMKGESGSMNGERRSYETSWAEYESPSTAVVVAVAEATGREQRALPVLNEYVDGDALDSLLTDSTNSVEFSFRYGTAMVHVSGDGSLQIETFE